MLKNVTGDARDLLDSPRLRAMTRFADTQLGGDGRLLTFNDTQPLRTAIAVMADLGSRFDDPLMRWLADRFTRSHMEDFPGHPYFEDNRSVFSFFAFLWRDKTPAPDRFPEVSTVATLGILNWGVMRSESAFKPGLMIGIKGRGGQTTHHNQPDHGSYAIYANGENFLIDPGYYQGEEDKHSIPLIAGAGPNKGKKALITEAWYNSSLRHSTLDVTDSYASAGIERGKRLYTLYQDKAIVILDDFSADGEAMTAQYQCLLKPSVGGLTVSQSGDSSAMTFRCFGPDIQLADPDSMHFGRSWIFKKLYTNWWRVQGTYVNDPATPLVTVYTPHASGTAAPPVNVSYASTAVTVTLPDNTRLVYGYDAANGWLLPMPADAVGTRQHPTAKPARAYSLDIRHTSQGILVRNSSAARSTIVLTNLSGRIVRLHAVAPSRSHLVKLSTVARGVYMLRVSAGNEVRRERIVVR
jgi:hypothetical protein